MKLSPCIFALVALMASAGALAQARLVNGTVYVYVGKDGARTYATTPPKDGATTRTIKYSYFEGQKAYPPYIFRCRVGKEERYFAEPFVGCMVVGAVAMPKRTFGGFTCQDDCSGHQAGYNWAAQYHVVDAARCSGGKSQSFIEGCIVRARGVTP